MERILYRVSWALKISRQRVVVDMIAVGWVVEGALGEYVTVRYGLADEAGRTLFGC